MPNDALVLLKNDHREIKKVFRDFRRGGDLSRKSELVTKMIELLTIHTYIENEVMYPQLRELLPELDDDVLESYEEHHVADVLAYELFSMSLDRSPDAEHFSAKATVLIEMVEHHIEEEEQKLFPKVRNGVPRKKLQELGQQMEELKQHAPTTPTDPRAAKSALDAVTA